MRDGSRAYVEVAYGRLELVAFNGDESSKLESVERQ